MTTPPRLAVALPFLLAALACGKMGDPMPPPRYVPAPTKDLAVQQRGTEVTLTLGHPTATVSGGALPGLSAVELWELTRPAPEGETPAAVDPRQFELAASKLLVLSGAELTGATSGDRIVIRHLLEESEEPIAHTFAVRTVASTGETSDFSNQVTLVPVSPPSPPTTMTAVATGEGIEIHWEDEEREIAGYHVYRRDARNRQFGDPLARVDADQRSYLDRSARFGERYIYALRALAGTEPLVESATALEREIHYLDRFAPPAPVGLLSLPEEGRIRLRWQGSPASDLAGYFVFRADPETDFRRLDEEPLAAREYLDTGLVGGLTYRYRLTAVDAEGNESPTSETVEAQPR